MKLSHLIAIAAVGCALTAGTLEAGTGSRSASASSRLVIHRAANFGMRITLNVYVDGALVGNAVYNRDVDALVPAGVHVVTLEQVPRYGASYLITQQRISFAPGGTSVFTAMTDDGGTRAVLEPS